MIQKYFVILKNSIHYLILFTNFVYVKIIQVNQIIFYSVKLYFFIFPKGLNRKRVDLRKQEIYVAAPTPQNSRLNPAAKSS